MRNGISSRFRTVSGIRIHFLEHRCSPEAVLLLHGNSSCGGIFGAQVRSLIAAGLSVVVPDLPGHGLSEDAMNARQTYSFPGYAALLDTLMADLGYSAIHVVGWSLGGHIGLELCSRSAAYRSLLLTGTPPVALNAASIAEGFRWTPTTALAGRSRLLPEDLRRYVSAMLGARSPGKPHLEAARRTDGLARSWMVSNGLAGRGIDGRAFVETWPRPVAIVQGEDDPFVRTAYIAGLAYRNIWRGGPVFLAAGHAPHWQKPVEFNRHMKLFIEDVRGGANAYGY